MAIPDEQDCFLEEIRMPGLRVPRSAVQRDDAAAAFCHKREAARTGVGLLVTSAAVPFAALVVAYMAFRLSRAEVFLFGRYYRDADTGLLACLTFLLSAFTSVLAARFSASRRPRESRLAIVA